MTLNQCLTALEQHLRDDPEVRCWMTDRGSMRIGRIDPHTRGWHRGVYCPITYTAEREGKGTFDCADVERAAVAIDLAHEIMRRLVRAADNIGSPRTRQRLEAIWQTAKQQGAL